MICNLENQFVGAKGLDASLGGTYAALQVFKAFQAQVFPPCPQCHGKPSTVHLLNNGLYLCRCEKCDLAYSDEI